MQKLLKDRWPILALPLPFYIVDEALTWAGQPRPPAGRPPSEVFEMNPVVRRAVAGPILALTRAGTTGKMPVPRRHRGAMTGRWSESRGARGKKTRRP
jgi:hypothetical protein